MSSWWCVCVCVCVCVCEVTRLALPPVVLGLPGGATGKEPACQCRRQRDTGSAPGLGRPPGGGDGNPLQCFCLEHPMDRRACQPWYVGSPRVRHD